MSDSWITPRWIQLASILDCFRMGVNIFLLTLYTSTIIKEKYGCDALVWTNQYFNAIKYTPYRQILPRINYMKHLEVLVEQILL